MVLTLRARDASLPLRISAQLAPITVCEASRFAVTHSDINGRIVIHRFIVFLASLGPARIAIKYITTVAAV